MVTSEASMTALISLIPIIIGMLVGIWKIASFMAKIENQLVGLVQDRPMVRSIPTLTYRVSNVERHLNIDSPSVPSFGNNEN